MAMTEQDKIDKYGPVVCLVRSASDPTKQREIRTKDGTIHTCACTGFVMDRKKAEAEHRLQTCKHVNFYLKKKGEHDQRMSAGIETEKTIISGMLAAVGLVGTIREAVGNRIYENKLELMARHLKPHITGKDATKAATAAIEAGLAAGASCGEDDLRVLVLDD
jgi:hypothetical protein